MESRGILVYGRNEKSTMHANEQTLTLGDTTKVGGGGACGCFIKIGKGGGQL